MSGSIMNHLAAGDSRNINGKSPSSRVDDPLRRFTEAKKAIGDIYEKLSGHVDKFSDSLKDLSTDFSELLSDEQSMREVARIQDSIRTIKEVFGRDHMKVVFFGRTSNGKSSVINSMLGEKILPQGMGHTTCCFLQVEGCVEVEKYLLAEGSAERIDFTHLHNLGHALSSSNSSLPQMGQDSLVRVFCPRSKSKLLQNEVVLVDSPGVDVSPEFDSWIDKHCLDADVFVLVCNAESTLTQAEKQFFHRVSAKLSKPNIFILNNRWDASANEPNIEQVKEQHMARFRQFLSDELKVASSREVNDRIFFISAREMLDVRMEVKQPYRLEGYQDRAREFSRFEEHFESCISRSAIRTKFEAHLRRAQEILDKVQSNIASVNGAIDQEKKLKLVEKGRREDELQSGMKAFRHFEELCKRQGENLRAEVHLKVAADFTEEIQRLESIIDKFDHNFVDDPQKIVEYKEALSQFVDELVTRELEERCTGGLMQRIWKLENDMFNHVNSILPGPYPQRLEAVWKYRNPVQFRITVNCPALVEDFHEDLEFRFSFGITALMRRFIAFRAGQPITAIGEPLAMRSNGPSTSESKDLAVRDNADQAVMVNAFVLSTASYVANGGVGLVYRTVGWKVIATGAGIYGGLYLIERLRWNSHAKEQHLKEQFRSHLAVRMRQVAASHTANCESQAISELEAAEKGLKVAVTGFHMEMKTNTGLLKGSIDRLEEIVKKLKSISFDVGSLKSKLEEFQANFLKADSPTKQ